MQTSNRTAKGDTPNPVLTFAASMELKPGNFFRYGFSYFYTIEILFL